jgi:type III restriction enzyme
MIPTPPSPLHATKHKNTRANIPTEELRDFMADDVFAYVKNQNLGFTIPYTLNGEQHSYYPDFIVRIDDGHGPENPLNLVLKCTGQKKKDKEAKVSTALTLWVPAVNAHGAFGRWDFLEILDPWEAANTMNHFFARRKKPTKTR